MENMSKSERQLEAYFSLIKELVEKQKKAEGELRFNRHFIIASDIADQYFCEKKVEMRYFHGEVVTEDKIIGTEAHEKLLEDSEQVERRELWQRMHGEKPVLALELFLLAKYKGIVLAGKPDGVMFQRGHPLVVFEYKFSKSTIAYRTHHVQAETYGILLRNMGFDTRGLFYAVVMADPKARHDKSLKQDVVQAVGKNGPKEAVLNIRNAVIYVQKFDEEDAEKDLDWAIEFWRDAKEPIVTSNPNKCRSCEYKVECQRSLRSFQRIK
jgi:CRISPR/Cas system-associated exonuclease Cas4 (RecB family)